MKTALRKAQRREEEQYMWDVGFDPHPTYTAFFLLVTAFFSRLT